MAYEYDELEFTLWLESLTKENANLEKLLAEAEISAEKVNKACKVVAAQLVEIQRLKPKQKAHYDYKPAIPVIVKAKTLITQAECVLLAPETAQPVHSTAAAPARRIPELHITKFEGDITKFSSFIASFQMKYSQLPITDSEKLQHLKENVGGDALKLIDRYELIDVNYVRAIEQLNDAFSSKEDTISALYAKLKTLPVATNSDASLQHNYYEIESLLGALEAHGQNLDAFPPLRDEVYYKYPAWLIHQACGKERLPVRAFQKEVGEHIKIRLNLHANAPPQPKKNATVVAVSSSKSVKPKRSSTEHTFNTSQGTTNPPTITTTKRPPNCVFCDQQHYSAECTTYRTLSDRKARISDRCIVCLSKDHTTNACTREIRCYYCKKVKEHHSCMCAQKFNSNDIVPPPKSTPNIPEKPRTSAFVQKHTGAHSTALITIVNPLNQRRFRVRALLDNGSNESYISEIAARRIGLELSEFKVVPVNVFHQDTPVKFRSAVTTCTVTNNSEFNINMVVDTAPRLPQEVHLFDMAEFLLEYPEYRETTFVDQSANHPIEILIGSDYFYDIISADQRTKIAEGLYMIATPFGMLLVGRQRDRNNDKSILFQMSPEKAMEQLCSLEAIGIREKPLSIVQEEEMALTQFYNNIEFIDNRYQIRLPWKEFPPHITDNFGVAISRLKSVLRRFNIESFTEYAAIITQQLESGVIEEVENPNINNEVRYYLPHHPVISPEKSTLVRIVFDGSVKSKMGRSINDAIYKGVNLLHLGVSIIIRFRLQIIAVVADIEKAFHQLLSHPDDRRFLMFIFIHDFLQPAAGRNLRFFRFLRYVFGIIASPFVLQATVKYHLHQNKDEFTGIIEENLYVDGVLTGRETREEAERFYRSAIALFAKCSMNLRKWASNDSELRLQFDQPDKSAAISILGLQWTQYNDTITIKAMIPPVFENSTLRSVLSKIAQFYDPCGYFTPVTVVAKIFLREIHATYEWDEIINEEHQKRWREIYDELHAATQIPLQRFQCSIVENGIEYELHAFADASSKACAAVVYLVRRTHDNITAYLLFARSKLAKLTDIPKLELIAAYMAVQMLQFTKTTLKTQLWSDALCVLSWIQNTARVLPIFIQRRIDEIRNIPGIEKRYIAGAVNPADIPSRGSTTQALLESMWFTGPIEWIKNPPETPPIPSTYEICTFVITQPTNITPKSSPFDLNAAEYADKGYLRLLAVTATALRFVSAFQSAQNFRFYVANATLMSAQHVWLRFEQHNAYADVIAAIENRRSHPLISKLNLYIDQRGLIRCAGRFCYAPLSQNERQPILLPPARDSAFTRLLITYFHVSGFHRGTGYTLLALRRRFWLPAGRRAVFNVLAKCTKCRRFTTRPYQQPFESPLPQFRLDNTTIPFQNIGIDTCGPFIVPLTS